jgi:asparagine N-glycosylation enzyme membrane subunit Stt3
MTDHNTEIASLKARLSKSGLTGDDLEWFDSLEWRDTNVPPPAPDQVERYKRREAALNADIANLGVMERGSTSQSRLAAAIGARLADLRDRADDDDD